MRRSPASGAAAALLLALAAAPAAAQQQNTQGQGTEGPAGGSPEVQSVVPEVGDGRGGMNNQVPETTERQAPTGGERPAPIPQQATDLDVACGGRAANQAMARCRTPIAVSAFSSAQISA